MFSKTRGNGMDGKPNPIMIAMIVMMSTQFVASGKLLDTQDASEITITTSFGRNLYPARDFQAPRHLA